MIGFPYTVESRLLAWEISFAFLPPVETARRFYTFFDFSPLSL
jgi:hypothetical protein